MIGFPGADGTREGYVVRYNIVSGLIQPTTLGELDERITPRLRAIAAVFQAGGFPVALSGNMDAWLKTHATPPAPEGVTTLPLDWRGVWIGLAALVGLVGFYWLNEGLRDKMTREGDRYD